MEITRLKLGIIGFFVFIFTGFVGLRYIKTSPQYSIFKMYKAVEAHDYDTFKKYIDVDSVVDNLINEVFTKVEQEEASEDEWTQLGKDFAEGLVMMMKPRLKEEMKTEIKKQIEEGEFKKEYKPQNIIKAFTNIKVQKEGKVANVTLIKEGEENLKLKMRKKDSYWQVFNMELPIPEIEEDKKPQQDENVQNLKFGEKADIGKGWFLIVNEPVLYESKSSWDKAEESHKLVASEVVYENTTQETSYFSLNNLKLKDVENHSYSPEYGGKEPQLESGDLEAGGKVKGFVTFEILGSNDIKSIVYSGNYSTVIFSQ